ncbi:hypothetical protein NC651_007909 [Populus alba x Populus x berolinensis]|nr:hypothetical protein NC651_007909 [Populus alba x Populus x berolinensis]
MNEGKNIQISRSRDSFLGSGTAVFYCKPLPFDSPPYICCVVNYYLFPTSPIVRTSYCIRQN